MESEGAGHDDELADLRHEVAELRAALAVAVEAAEAADVARGEAEGRLRLAYVDLEKWNVHHEEAARALDVLTLQNASLAEQLEAIRTSRSWLLIQRALAPYRWVRGRR